MATATATSYLHL